MSRMKSVLAVLVLTAMVVVMPTAHAQTTIETTIAGSSAQWQTMALGAYDLCVSSGLTSCGHFTSGGSASYPNFSLVDNRPNPTVVDTGAIWIVWGLNASNSYEVWSFIKVDSGVGDRCYYAAPRCDVNISSFPTGNGANLISLNVTGWGASGDTQPPPQVSGLFVGGNTGGLPEGVAATDIRAEDALWATCRTNSKGPPPTGLGYNTNFAAGLCPTSASAVNAEGTPIKSEDSGNVANVVSWSLTKDPITGTSLPTKYITAVPVGAAPVIFVTHAQGPLSNVTDATDAQLQSVFSGTNCNGNAFTNGTNGAIDAWLREPLSGTYNTADATVFYYNGADPSGVDQENGVDLTQGNTNPLNLLCSGGGGSRKRGVGTGDVVNGVASDSSDAITYTFFSYGNVKLLADSANFHYLTLDGVDGIFHTYNPSSKVDPGQPGNGTVPGAADTPCGSFPCPEGQIWAYNTGVSADKNKGLSFPNVRNGSYRAWSLFRGISDSCTTLTCKGFSAGQVVAFRTLVAHSNAYVVGAVPDYIPYAEVVYNNGNYHHTDPGLKLLRSHFQQKDGQGNPIGGAPINIAATGDVGGDMGGCILPSSGVEATSDTTVQLFQAEPENHCVSFKK